MARDFLHNEEMTIQFHNTLSGRIEPLNPLKPGTIGLYTCGPTVYDFPHIGNCRAYVFEDLLKRFLMTSGYKVTHIMNITDVDDKTIKGANALGLSLREYTEKYVDAFFQDQKKLNILPADHYPRATDHIPEMVAIVKTLLDKGYAYAKDGSIYFSIDKFPAYGALSKIKRDDLQPGRRIESDEYEKESLHDFALWKNKKEGEPFWETEIGPGRPGWHIECSAMSQKYLGETFDIHCGGVDNIFPHHENEIAQSEASNGRKFVNTWLHCHHLIVDGEKMSKSKGNFFTLGDLISRGADPLDLRYLLLATHYRKMLNFTFDALAQAKTSRQRLLDFLYELEHRSYSFDTNPDVAKLTAKAETGFQKDLGDDLNISGALSAIFDFVREVNTLLSQDKIGRIDADHIQAILQNFNAVLAILPRREENDLPPEIKAKIDEREKARKEKDFDRADQLRGDLLSMGILLEDTKDGVRWKRVAPSTKK